MGDCSNEKVPRDSAANGQVRDVMVSRPKTLPAAATVADLRALFDNPHVATALLVDGTRFAGAIDRDSLPDDAPAQAHATGYVRAEHATTTPDASMGEALAQLDETGTRRLVVLAEDGVTLSGLLCLDGKRTGFCIESS
ncbi:MAG: CBS domain-containing protein [Gaiellaceae bacterium]